MGLGAQGQDRTMCRQVVGGAAGCSGDQNTVAHQVVDLYFAVDEDTDMSSLVQLAQQCDLVDGQRRCFVARLRDRYHA